MNQRLARFLLDLLRDPARLRAFNIDPDRESMVSEARLADALSAEDERALLSGDASEILRQLAVSPEEADQLMWTIGPGIKPRAGGGGEQSYLVGFGIKGPTPPLSESTRLLPTARKRGPGALRKGGTARKRPTKRPTKRSKKGGGGSKGGKR
jgi:hypothetical protein